MESGLPGPCAEVCWRSSRAGYMEYMEGRSKLSHTLFASQGRGCSLVELWWVSADLRPWVNAHCSQQRRAPQRKQRRRREVRYIQCTRGTTCVQTGKTGGVHGCPDEKLQPADGSAGAVDDDDSSPVVSWAQRIPSPRGEALV